jgi:hypothetical protein
MESPEGKLRQTHRSLCLHFRRKCLMRMDALRALVAPAAALFLMMLLPESAHPGGS